MQNCLETTAVLIEVVYCYCFTCKITFQQNGEIININVTVARVIFNNLYWFVRHEMFTQVKGN